MVDLNDVDPKLLKKSEFKKKLEFLPTEKTYQLMIG